MGDRVKEVVDMINKELNILQKRIQNSLKTNINKTKFTLI